MEVLLKQKLRRQKKCKLTNTNLNLTDVCQGDPAQVYCVSWAHVTFTCKRTWPTLP